MDDMTLRDLESRIDDSEDVEARLEATRFTADALIAVGRAMLALGDRRGLEAIEHANDLFDRADDRERRFQKAG